MARQGGYGDSGGERPLESAVEGQKLRGWPEDALAPTQVLQTVGCSAPMLRKG